MHGPCQAGHGAVVRIRFAAWTCLWAGRAVALELSIMKACATGSCADGIWFSACVVLWDLGYTAVVARQLLVMEDWHVMVGGFIAPKAAPGIEVTCEGESSITATLRGSLWGGAGLRFFTHCCCCMCIMHGPMNP